VTQMSDNENQNVETPPTTDGPTPTKPQPASADDHDNVSSGHTVSDRPSTGKPFDRDAETTTPPMRKPLTPTAASSSSTPPTSA
jgi:hypothetical protein